MTKNMLRIYLSIHGKHGWVNSQKRKINIGQWGQIKKKIKKWVSHSNYSLSKQPSSTKAQLSQTWRPPTPHPLALSSLSRSHPWLPLFPFSFYSLSLSSHFLFLSETQFTKHRYSPSSDQRCLNTQICDPYASNRHTTQGMRFLSLQVSVTVCRESRES